MNIRTTALLGMLATLLAGPAAWADDEGMSFSGKLTVGKRISYLYYFGEESGDSRVWYFDTRSPAGKAILAVCKPNRPCYGTGSTRLDTPPPKGLPEVTSGSERITRVSRVSRRPD